MPAYNLLNPPPALEQGGDRYLFGTTVAAGTGPTPGVVQAPNDANVVTEAAATGVLSQQVHLCPRANGGAPGVIVQVIASADPGAAEVDIQDAAIDITGAYLTPNNAAYKLTVWTAMADGTGRYMSYTELQPEGTRFMRLKVVANPNAVTWIAKVVYV